MPTPAALRIQFIKAFNRLAHHRERHDVLADFLELAVCAIRKTTVPAGPEADALEEQYMGVVRRNRPEDIRVMPELLGITALALQDGGCDFLGGVITELELTNSHMGQFFTPYDLSRMMAEMTLDTVDEVIAEQGFVTVQEPACGAGGMMIAAADVLARKGFDISRHLYVDAIDISPTCFRMSYLQASLRGIPALIRRGNTLSLEMFDQAVTPAFHSFYAVHGEAFEAWRRGEGRGGVSHDATLSQESPEAEPVPIPSEPVPPLSTTSSRHPKAAPPRQLNLFD